MPHSLMPGGNLLLIRLPAPPTAARPPTSFTAILPDRIHESWSLTCIGDCRSGSYQHFSMSKSIAKTAKTGYIY